MLGKQLRKSSIYQLKITLVGIRPPIWRRVLIPSNLTFLELHQVIQASFGWYNYHLYQFSFSNLDIVAPIEDEFSCGVDFGERQEKKADKVKINKLLEKEAQCIYEYDFGDSWEHKIVLEKVLPFAEEEVYPRCVKGKRCCPPEDVGGIWGYRNFLKIMSDPEHGEHASMLEWIDAEEPFDPEYFNLEEINEILSGILD